MNCIVTPSLEHMALAKMAVELWNQDDIRSLIRLYFSLPERSREKWREIENKVKETVPQFSLPECLTDKILGFIRPIGLHAITWMEYHRHLLSLGYVTRNLNRLCWTPQGTVDEKKTAKVLIKDETLDITLRYELACIYCLEEEIHELWDEVPESRRTSFYSEEDPDKVKQKKLVVLWTYDIKGEVGRMHNMIERELKRKCSPYQYAFESAAVSGNKAAIEYFLQKLTPKERKKTLVRHAGYVLNRHSKFLSDLPFPPEENYADVFCFLLSQMEEEQQIKIFESHSYEVLGCFLEWPCQSLVMKAANRLWNFLSGMECSYYLFEISYKMMEGLTDYDYRKLFGEFWQQCPTAHKKDIYESPFGHVLSIPFKINDKKNIKLILNDASLEEKNYLISCESGQMICKNLMYGDKWDLLKFFIRECISSKNEMIKFKEEFKKPLTRFEKENREANKEKWTEFFQLLDDIICGYDDKKE